MAEKYKLMEIWKGSIFSMRCHAQLCYVIVMVQEILWLWAQYYEYYEIDIICMWQYLFYITIAGTQYYQEIQKQK